MKAKKICAGAMALVLSMGTMSAFTGNDTLYPHID